MFKDIVKFLSLGTRNFLYFYRNNIPLTFFWKWLLERWKYDLNIILLLPIMLPYILMIFLSEMCEIVAEKISDIIPDKWLPSENKMQEIVRETIKWEKDNGRK